MPSSSSFSLHAAPHALPPRPDPGRAATSHLLFHDPRGAWDAHPLYDDLVELAGSGPIPLAAPELLGSVSGPVVTRACGSRGREQWMLILRPGDRTRVNGTPVPVGACSLAHRDAIAVACGYTVFVTYERIARVTPFPGENDRTCCIRCNLPIDPGTPAVQCPGAECGLWAHQSQDQPCWTYTETCASCGHPTAFDAGFQWSPAEL